MQLKENMRVCATCKRRETDIKRGIVCGITGQKPSFEDGCPSFMLDDAKRWEAAQNENLTKYGKCLAEYGGQPDSANVSLKGSVWFYVIALFTLLAIFSVLFPTAFGEFGYLSGLVSSLISLGSLFAETSISWLAVIFYVLMLAFPLFFVWVGYATYRKMNGFAYLVGWVVYAVDTVVYAVWALTYFDAVSAIYLLLLGVGIHILILCLPLFNVFRLVKNRALLFDKSRMVSNIFFAIIAVQLLAAQIFMIFMM
jgi:hypothetical protein